MDKTTRRNTIEKPEMNAEIVLVSPKPCFLGISTIDEIVLADKLDINRGVLDRFASTDPPNCAHPPEIQRHPCYTEHLVICSKIKQSRIFISIKRY